MMRRGLLLAALSLTAAAQAGVRIAGPSSPAPGAAFVMERSRRWREAIQVELAGEVLHEQSASGSLAYVCKVEVVSGTETKLTFEKATYEDGGRVREMELDGKTIVMKREGDEVSFALAGGGEPTDDASEFLEGEFGRARKTPSLLPPDEVATGETWRVSLEDLAGRLGLEWDAFRAEKFEGAARLAAIAEKDGASMATIEIALDAAPEAMDGNRLTESELTIAATLEVPVEGTVPYRSLSAKASLSGVGAPEKGTADIMTEYRMTFELEEKVRP